MKGDAPAPAVRPIRVGYVIGQLTHGGAERQLYELVRGIDRARFACVVYCLSDSTRPFGEMIAASGITVRALPRAHRLDLGRVLGLARLARADQCDILHSFLVHASGYAWPARRLAGVAHLITSARSGRTAGTVRDWIIRQAFQASDAVVCNGDAVREFITRSYGILQQHCLVIPNGIDLARFSVRPRRWPDPDGRGSPTIVTVARLVTEKDLPLFLEAAALLRAGWRSARFVVIGEGPCRDQLQRAADQLHLGDAVSFLGERSDVPELLEAAHVFWLTSASEGLPNALLEAQASAMPVVTRDVGAVREVIHHGVTGYVVPGRDPGAFAAFTHRLLTNSQQANAMGLAGRKVVEERFSVAAMVRSTEQLYRDVVGR